MTQSKFNADQQRGPLWRIFLAGPVVYALYFIAVYILGEFGCLAGIHRLNFLGWNPVQLGVAVLTLLATLVVLGAAYVSFRRWRLLRTGPEDPEEEDPEFMLFVGLWLNSFFTGVILLTAVPLLLGSGCTWI